MIGTARKHFDSVDSTNIVARSWALDGAPHGAIVTANQQTAGRGRTGRTWVSPPNKGLYLSVILRGENDPEKNLQPQQYTLLLAVAACRALETFVKIPAQTKWPNDILLQGHKAGGILSSGEWNQGKLDFVIAGIGLNINQSDADLPERALYPATSLRQISGHELDIAKVLEKVLLEINRINIPSDWSQIRAEFEQRCIFMNEVIGLQVEGKKYFGVAERVDDDGFLWLRTTEGSKRFVSGEIVE